MASRAHAHDYYGHPPPRPRHAVRYPGGDDPVLLPRDRSASANAVLIASGLVATAIIAGGAYAVYAGVPPPPMAETPTSPLVVNYRLDDEPLKAKLFERLVGSARAVPDVGTSAEPTEEADTPTPEEVGFTSTPTPAPRPMPATPAPTPAPSEPEAPPALYPDPTTTPPDAIAPPGSGPETPQPLLDPENPYR